MKEKRKENENSSRLLRVAAYVRISAAEELRDSGSFENQRAFFEQYIKSHPGWCLAGIYGDYARSGRQLRGRDGFLRMLKDGEEGKFDYLLCKSVSRFARNTADCVESIRRLMHHGISCFFREQGFDTGSASSELILTVLATIAEMESRSSSENLLETHRGMNAAGSPMIPARYGYKRTIVPGSKRKSKEWTVVPEEARYVKLIYLMAANGFHQTEIANRLHEITAAGNSGGSTSNKAGALSQRRFWTAKRVAGILHSEVYTGDILTNKTTCILSKNGKKQVRNRGIVDQFLCHDHHAPLISHALFDALQSGAPVSELRELAAGDSLLKEARESLLWKTLLEKNNSESDTAGSLPPKASPGSDTALNHQRQQEKGDKP